MKKIILTLATVVCSTMLLTGCCGKGESCKEGTCESTLGSTEVTEVLDSALNVPVETIDSVEVVKEVVEEPVDTVVAE